MLARIPLALAAYTAFANAQAGPNTLYATYPLDQTQSINGTYTVIAMNKTLVASLVYPKKLVDIQPDANLYPQGFPADTHPVTVFGGYDGSIKQAGLEINFLMQARIEIPCVDQLGDGKTCFRKQLSVYLGGENGQLASGLVPATAASLVVGTSARPGMFDPTDYPTKDLGNNQYAFEVNALVVDNPVSGPGVAPQAFQFVNTKGAQGPVDITEKGFQYLLNQVIISNNGVLCFNSPSYYAESFAQPYFGSSKVDILSYPLNLNGVDSKLAGSYTGSSYSVNSEMVTFKQTDCASAQADLVAKSV